MNNYSFENQMKQLEIAEARKKMGISSTGAASLGISNYSSGYTNMTSDTTQNLSNSTAVGYGQMQNANQQMNQYSYTAGTTTSITNYSNVPSLSDSTTINNAERQKAMINMNTTSMY